MTFILAKISFKSVSGTSFMTRLMILSTFSLPKLNKFVDKNLQHLNNNGKVKAINNKSRS